MPQAATQIAKYHGLGNDFVVVDLRAGEPAAGPSIQDPAVVRAVCNRHMGVGADGVLAILPPGSGHADATMRVLNADGSEAEMCGNGIRCVIMHLWQRDPALRRDRITLDTGAGPLTCEVMGEAGGAVQVSVDMGRPRLTRGEIPMTGPAGERCVNAPLEVGGRELTVTAVSMGNPHAVSFVSESGEALMALARSIGPLIETHPWFPRKTNAELARVHAPDRIELVVWERGCGITLACGTGACATAVAACLTGQSRPGTDIEVRLPGGPLAIHVAPDLSRAIMTGPARHVFDTSLDLSALALVANA
jgi:diaminopimelate epimerase